MKNSGPRERSLYTRSTLESCAPQIIPILVRSFNIHMLLPASILYVGMHRCGRGAIGYGVAEGRQIKRAQPEGLA